MDNARSRHRKEESTRADSAEGDRPPSGNGQSWNGAQRSLHRISQVRVREGVSLRTISRRWKMEISELRELEDENTDLTLSQLYRWQQILDVPVSELLIELDEPLSAPVMRRAQMIRLMKTAATLVHRTRSPKVHHLARMLMDQLIEMMPELDGIGPWQEEQDAHRAGLDLSGGKLAPQRELDD